MAAATKYGRGGGEQQKMATEEAGPGGRSCTSTGKLCIWRNPRAVILRVSPELKRKAISKKQAPQRALQQVDKHSSMTRNFYWGSLQLHVGPRSVDSNADLDAYSLASSSNNKLSIIGKHATKFIQSVRPFSSEKIGLEKCCE